MLASREGKQRIRIESTRRCGIFWLSSILPTWHPESELRPWLAGSPTLLTSKPRRGKPNIKIVLLFTPRFGQGQDRTKGTKKSEKEAGGPLKKKRERKTKTWNFKRWGISSCASHKGREKRAFRQALQLVYLYIIWIFNTYLEGIAKTKLRATPKTPGAYD